ncbi:hypothetical protein QE152_g21746 [Popillia japonica]|uniref:Uncharacterized protein n=1 Tax=Popillia japonica TaxID=7064 RepID=A0AAW1KML0_POPJA
MSGAIAELEINAANGNFRNAQSRKLSKTQVNANENVFVHHIYQNKLENNASTIANGVNNADECESKLSTAGAVNVAVDVLEENRARQSEVVKQAPNAEAVGQTKNGALADRKKLLQKMSTMEQESLLEKEHLQQIRSCSAIIRSDAKYTRDSFRRLFLSELSISLRRFSILFDISSQCY